MDIKPLISILIPCYNNDIYLQQSLSSIFEQTYPNIEILIGDDHSEDFKAELIIDWISANRTPNITKIVIVENEDNLGTVANLENLQNKCHGEYLFHLAADDSLYDPNVLSDFYRYAVQAGANALYVTAQTEMWDNTLQNKLNNFVSDSDILLIKNSTSKELFGICAYHPFIPASSFYHRSLLEVVGSLATNYDLIEDWPTHLRILRQGIALHYIDRSFIKHRDGGISHGNKLHSSQTFLKYYCDLINVFINEVEPYKNLLSESDYNRAKRYYEDRIRAYYTIHLPNFKKASVIQVEQKNSTQGNNVPNIMTKNTWKQIRTDRWIDTIKNKTHEYSRIKIIILTIHFMLLSFITAGTILSIRNIVGQILSLFFLYIGFLFFVLVSCEIIINIIFRLRSTMYRRHETIGTK